VRPKLKICGMRNRENIREVAALLPDYMGFIFYEKSKRFIGGDFSIDRGLSSTIKRVGVFVNENRETIFKEVLEHQLDFVQFHGNETVDECAILKDRGVGVIKVFSMDPHFDFNRTKSFEPYVDFFLFDTRSENYGGSGKSFDWSLLSRYNQQIPFFLSGGLSIENTQNIESLTGMNLHAIDLNSGVESSPGLKDLKKIKATIEILNSLSKFSI
jgi:phosphoribosylanthranilate isomerase